MQFKKVLVPVNGTKADEAALRLACSQARRNKGKILVRCVIQVKRTLPLDADIEPEIERGEQVLEQAERIAEDEDYEVQTELLQARDVGVAVVEEALEQGVDLVLIGLEYKKHFGQFSLGSIVPYVLKNAPCRVMILREPVAAREVVAG